MSKGLDRRLLLKVIASMKFMPAPALLNLLIQSKNALAEGEKKFLVTVRPVFCLRDPAATNYDSYLKPLSGFKDSLKILTGLESNGDGDEYHGGKQKRFATCCRPIKGTHTTQGGGSFDGASFDVVVGRHQKEVLKVKEDCLILGAFPYSKLQTTFEGISFSSKNQYIAPFYDFKKIYAEIKSGINSCAGEKVKLDIEELKFDKKILQAIEREYGLASQKHTAEVKEQLLDMEKKYSELVKAKDEIIKNDGFNQGDCLEINENPLAHSFVGNWPLADVPENYEPHFRNMNHLAAMALASNYTASVTLNYNLSGHEQPNVPSYHSFTHASFAGRTQEEGNKALDRLAVFQLNMFSHLLQELQKANVLDQTIVIYSPHERPTHFHVNTPIIASGIGAGVKDFNRKLMVNDMAADLLKIFGVANANNFGAETAKGGVLV